MADADTIIAALTKYQPEPDGWGGLDALIEALWATGEPERGVDALFGVWERFPAEDGYGVFWTILHGLESLPDCGPALVASVRRQPMEFNVLMVSRLLNAGQSQVGGVDARALLREVLAHPRASDAVRQDAAGSLERHGERP